MNSALDSEEKPSNNLNTRMISQLRSSERPSLESTSSIPDLVIYNRVPKCGSTTMLQVLNHVKDENNFTIFNQIEPDLPVSHISWFETVVACSLKTKKIEIDDTFSIGYMEEPHKWSLFQTLPIYQRMVSLTQACFINFISN